MKNSRIRILSNRFRLGIALVIASVVGCTTSTTEGPPQVGARLDPPTQAFAGAPSLTVSVVDETGAPVAGWRWLLEEDVSYDVKPGVPATDSPGVSIHKSHAPTLASGDTDADSATIPIPDDRRSFLSVLPKAHGWQMGSANILPGQTAATVIVHTPPLPTAQIKVYAFEDNSPLNSAPDIPAELPLEGFTVTISEQAGQQMMDAFGNPIGTTYATDGAGGFLLDADGAPVVDMMGEGYVLTNVSGEATIKYLNPGKYAILVTPPVGSGWVQTSTLEGSQVIDAWVGHAEPPWLVELGWFLWHGFFGFVQPTELPATGGAAGTISGKTHYVHENRPPIGRGNWVAGPIPNAWVALNDLSGSDQMVYAGPCAEDGSFTIENVPPGTWQLVTFDYSLDAIIDFRTVVMPEGGAAIDLGEIGAFGWFGNLEGTVFNDLDFDGMKDAGEMGIPGAGINLRFTDGSIYQATGTDDEGRYELSEIFPFFQWLIVEVDFARFKSTGATSIVDDGGEVAPGEVLTPQAQPENGGLGWRTEVGSHPAEILLEGMMLFAGQTNRIDWGKAAYGSGENGGIAGITYYAVTRAENDPHLAAMEEWEPGVPRVQVELYQDLEFDGAIDDLDGDGLPTRADVDNFPFGWRDAGAPGPEDWDRDGDGTFDPGDALQIVTTDSWDDNLPTGCPGDPQFVHGSPVLDCAETISTWNQVRPGLFDGGYAFASYFPGGIVAGGVETMPIPTGYYIVGASPPPGYEIAKEEDKNVDFGEEIIPFEFKNDPVLGPPVCVGEGHLVPPELTLFPGVETESAGLTLPLCDLKQVRITEGRNAAADFPMFTAVPKAGRVFGMVRNDLALTFDPNNPIFRDNLAPAWMPIAMNDWTGMEISRFYTDEFGHYTALVPSTYGINAPAPSGVAPNVLEICVNDPGPVEDPENPGQWIQDPWFNPAYAPMCLKFQYYPGKQTPLDTPVIPIAAFAHNTGRLDCEPQDHVPMVAEVSDPDGGGPYLPSLPGTLVIKSRGLVAVPNPDYDPADPLSAPLIDRDFGFGADGTVTIGGEEMTVTSWSPAQIEIDVPVGTTTGQLLVTRSDNGLVSPTGITVQIGTSGVSSVIRVASGGSIQDAIDAAPANALILVEPGVYRENLIVYKPLKLQGYGPFSTILEAGLLTPPQQAEWDVLLQSLVDDGSIELLPGQLDVVAIPGEGVDPPQVRFFSEKGGGIFVSFASSAAVSGTTPPRIDGLQIAGAQHGSGIFINSYVRDLQLANLRVYRNQGNFGGGIRAGTPSLIDPATGDFVSAENPRLNIHHSLITGNGGIDGGGGVTLFNGSDDYTIADNFICGNMTVLYGGGIDHFGRSDGGTIARNQILSNQSFDEGGGIIVAGELALPGGSGLTPGSGSVVIDSNTIVGNMGGDDGGGIRLLMVNGEDVAAAPADPGLWWEIDILNNVIANNVSWDAGGGISMDDAARVFLLNTTVAHNDATSTAVDAFGPCVPNVPPGTVCPNELEGGGLSTSVPQVGGIHARAHSTALQAAFDPSVAQTFADPFFEDCIIWQNRSFWWDAAANWPYGGLGPDIAGGDAPYYWDMAVVGTAGPEFLSPLYSILTDTAYPGGGGSYDASNEAVDPEFVDGSYFNSYLASSKGAAMGNFVMTTFQLPGSHGDYHIGGGSPAINLGDGAWLGTFPELGDDVDGEGRPFAGGVDSGADERH
ncbi:MAG: hypothetical protein HY907_14270 [Deltaproteobacteria bacterium]|nr:hypothetical protein [Deltaproteobacteria bacterium]